MVEKKNSVFQVDSVFVFAKKTPEIKMKSLLFVFICQVH